MLCYRFIVHSSGLVGELYLTFRQHIQYQRLSIGNRRSMIGPRFIYTPTPGHIVKLSVFGNGHNHAYLARWMAVMWTNDVFQIHHIDA